MFDRAEVAHLLALHARAFGLLMWLDEASAADPTWLAMHNAEQLSRGASAAVWLEAHRAELPPELMVADPRGAFANVFASFFSTSFRIEHQSFDNRLVSARIVRGVDANQGELPDRTGVRAAQTLALKHLAAAERLRITGAEANRIVQRRRDLRDDLTLWTYVWELGRRAKDKAKGPVAHRLWRGIPWQTKRVLAVEDVWAARQRLVDAVAEFRTSPDTDY
jgi:hypothetical protein